MGKIPEHWDMVPLRGVLEERREYNTGPKTENILSVVKDVGVINYDDRKASGNKKSDNIEQYKIIHKGDIVLNRMNVIIGSVGIAKEFGAASIEYYVLYSKENSSYTQFYAQIFSSRAFQTNLGRLGSGILGHRLRIPFQVLKKERLPKPPIHEQYQISAFLDRETARIDTLIEKKQLQIELLQQKRDALVHEIIQDAGTRNLRLGTVTDQVFRPVDHGDEKTYVPIGLYNRGRGIFHKEPTLGAELGDSDFFWIKSDDLVLSGQFAWEGAVALAGEEDAGCVATHRYPVFRGKPNVLDTAYLWAFFTTTMGDFLLNEHSRGAAGRNRPLNAGTLLKEKIPVPPMDEQLRVSRHVYFERQFEKLVADSSKLLAEYRTALISAAVTGKIDVRQEVA